MTTTPLNRIFAVVDEPYCLWGQDIKEHNDRFLDGLDPDYFYFVAQFASEKLDDESDKFRAAALLRSTYYQGIESLFLLIGALIQAPDCAYAWVSECRPSKLRMLLEKIEHGERPLHLRLHIPEFSWTGLARGVLSNAWPEERDERDTIEQFSRMWARLAHEYRDEKNREEHNSLKHGFRGSPGGFRLSVGVEKEYGVEAPKENMQYLGGSEYGSGFVLLRKVGSSSSKNRSYRTEKIHINWSAEGTAQALPLVASSIKNVVGCLKVLNGAPAGTVEFVRPNEDSMYDDPWNHRVPVSGMSMDTSGVSSIAKPTNRQELLEILRKSSEK